jgi:hypothetical protein
MFRRLLRRRAAGDAGAAMVTAILVMVVITGMGSVVVQVASANLRNAGRDRLAGGALGAAEAGLSAGLAYLNGAAGIGTVLCSPTCPDNPWGNKAAPHTFAVGTSGAKAEVWIKVKSPFNPPAVKVARYVIYSRGTSGSGPGMVKLEQTVDLKPFSYPIGVFAAKLDAGGSAGVHNESLFTTLCVNSRSHITFTPANGIDTWYGIRAGVHSTEFITNSENGCNKQDKDNIHRNNVCNPLFPYDRDQLGGSVSTTSQCAEAGGVSPPSTVFTAAMLEDFRGSQARGLTAAQYAALRAKAKAQGQFYTTTSFVPPDPNVFPNAVMYFDLNAWKNQTDTSKFTVQLGTELNAFGTNAVGTAGTNHCGKRSLVIVIDGGSMHINANADIIAALFVPDGVFQFNGKGAVHGTVFARELSKFNGTADFYLEPCFFTNLPGGLLEGSSVGFRVDDRGDPTPTP